MAAGRRSSDPKDLLLVDPSQPEATKRARRHLTKRAERNFSCSMVFSKALLGEVISAGWDQVDINNLRPLLQQPSRDKPLQCVHQDWI